MKRAWCLSVICIVLLCACASGEKNIWNSLPPPGLEITPGTYSAKWIVPPPSDSEVDWAYSAFKVDVFPDSYVTIERLPALVTKKPLRGFLIIGLSDQAEPQKKMAFILDESGGTGKGYDTLYLDTNLNRDLTDDEPLKGKLFSGYMQLRFHSALVIPFNRIYPSSKTTNDVTVDIGFDDAEKPDSGGVSLRGRWYGEIESNRGKIPYEAYPQFDFITGDLKNGDYISIGWGVLTDAKPSNTRGTIYRSETPENISDKLYLLETSAAGDKLTVKPYEGPSGKLNIHAGQLGDININLEGVFIIGESSAMWYEQTPYSILLPVGNYRLFANLLFTRDTAKYEMQADTIRPVTVSSEQTTDIDLITRIEPRLLMTDNNTRWKRGSVLYVWLGFKLSDNTCSVPYFVSSDKPLIEFKDSSGRVVSSSRMKYYTSSSPHQIVVPKRWEPGTYTAEITFTSPVFGDQKAVRTIEVE